MFAGEYRIERSQDYYLVINFLNENFSAPTHWPEWNTWVSEDNESDFYYWLLYHKDHLIGICPVHSFLDENKVIALVSGQYKFIPYGGWILSKKIDYTKIPKGITRTESFLAHSLPGIPDFKVDYPFGEEDKATLIVHLAEQTEEDLWMQSINSKRRNMIRKAEKLGIEVREVSTNQEFEDFYQAYCEASERNELTILPKAFFQRFLKAKHINLRLLNAYKGDRILSNLCLVFDKDYAIYWLGNNANDTINDGQGELLQWEAMKLALAEGCSYYDLCYIEPERLPHIYKFKKGFAKDVRAVSVLSQRTMMSKFLMKIKNI